MAMRTLPLSCPKGSEAEPGFVRPRAPNICKRSSLWCLSFLVVVRRNEFGVLNYCNWPTTMPKQSDFTRLWIEGAYLIVSELKQHFVGGQVDSVADRPCGKRCLECEANFLMCYLVSCSQTSNRPKTSPKLPPAVSSSSERLCLAEIEPSVRVFRTESRALINCCFDHKVR